MKATLPLPQLIRASSYFKEDGLLVVQGHHCFLRSVKDGVYLETLLEARDIEPGQMLIPQRSLKALSFADDSEVTFFENGQSSGYVTSLGASRIQKGSSPRLSTPHAAMLASSLRDINASRQGWVFPTRPFRRALRILQPLGSIRMLHGMMVAWGPHESIIVRSASFDSLPLSIVAAAVDPLITLLESNTEVVLKTGAEMSVVQGDGTTLGWSVQRTEPFNLSFPHPSCKMRLLKDTLRKLLNAVRRQKEAVVVRCDPDKAALYVEKKGLHLPLKTRVISGSPISVRIDPMTLYAHVCAMKGVEIEIAVGARWVQLRGAEVVPGRRGEFLEITTTLVAEPLSAGPET